MTDHLLAEKVTAAFGRLAVEKRKTRLSDLKEFPRYVIEYLINQFCPGNDFDAEIGLHVGRGPWQSNADQAFFEKERVSYSRPDWKGQINFDSLAIAVGTDAAAPMPQSQFQGIALLNVPEAAGQITQNIDVHSKTNPVGR